MRTDIGSEDQPVSNDSPYHINMEYVERIIVALRDMGTASTIDGKHLGFRGAGSRSAKEASRYVRDEMIRIGLTDVSLEEFPFDCWEFKGAWVEVPGLGRMQAASFGGSCGTNGEISGEIVDVGNGGKADYENKDVMDKIVLVNWPTQNEIGCIVVEASLHGASAVVLTTYDSRYGKAEGSLQCHDGIFKFAYPPLLSISGRDGLRIVHHLKRTKAKVVATVCSDIVITPRNEGGSGMNVVGYIPGERWGRDDDELLIIGDHTDAWFYGASDNNTGVAAVLAIADAFKRYYDEVGSRPGRTMIFIAHEAEEYGVVDTFYTWLWGAWYAISHHHPEWIGRTVAALFVDAIGFKGHPLSIEMTPELSVFTKRVLAKHGDRLPNGYDLHRPSIMTDLWPYAISGIASIAFSDWSDDYSENYYHSQYDDIGMIDMECVSAAFAVLADMAFELANTPIPPLDFAETAERLNECLKNECDHGLAKLVAADLKYNCGLSSSLEGLVHSCEVFLDRSKIIADALSNSQMDVEMTRSISHQLIGIQVSLGCSLLAMRASGDTAFPHEQSVFDFEHLVEAIEVLSGDQDHETMLTCACEALSHVGLGRLCGFLSEEAYQETRELFSGKGMISWGAASHLLPVIDVWDEYSKLQEMKNAVTLDDAQIESIRSALFDKLVSLVSRNLCDSIKTMQKGLDKTDEQMRTLISQIQGRGSGE